MTIPNADMACGPLGRDVAVPADHVRLVDVDDGVLDALITAATTDASANEVTAPITTDGRWSADRVTWLRDFHAERRAGLRGPLAEATWAIALDDDRVVGSLRLKATGDGGDMETGLWTGARTLRASTTESNAAAIAVLRRLGFTIAPTGDTTVEASLTLGDPTQSRGPSGR